MGGGASKPAASSAALVIEETFCFFDSQTKSMPDQPVMNMLLKNAPFVGTIMFDNGAVGTACLLDNNTIITCLHVILDYEAVAQERQLRMLNFSSAKAIVIFVKGKKLYCYNITVVDHSGFDTFVSANPSAPVSSYDYAVLQVDGNPCGDLGGGFVLDHIDHFRSAKASDPRKTLAISGPQIVHEAGKIFCHRHFSLANNLAAGGGNYHYQQAGNHHGAPGLSGQAILAVDVTQGYNRH